MDNGDKTERLLQWPGMDNIDGQSCPCDRSRACRLEALRSSSSGSRTRTGHEMRTVPQKRVGALNVFSYHKRGRWYEPDYSINSPMSITLVANRLCVVPFYVGETVIVDGIGINCTAAVASSRTRLGIYESDLSDLPLPKSLILETADLDTGTTGIKSFLWHWETGLGKRIWLRAGSSTGWPYFRIAPSAYRAITFPSGSWGSWASNPGPIPVLSSMSSPTWALTVRSRSPFPRRLPLGATSSISSPTIPSLP